MALLAASLALAIASSPVQAASGQLEQRLAQLSNSGSGAAAYNLGMLYHLGLGGVAKDERRAFGLFKLAADRGDPLGAYKVGCFYAGQGEGAVQTDAKLALKYKTIAAEAGYSLAQEEVGQHLLANGDTDGGLRWLEAAAAQGDRTPLLVLGSLYAGIVPPEAGVPSVTKNVVKGWAYLLIAARDLPEMMAGFEVQLSRLPQDEQAGVRAFVATWRARPTPLSQRGGIDEAYRLAGLPVPKT